VGKRDAPTSAEVLRALQLQEVRWQAILDTARDAIIGIEASTTTRAAGPSSAPRLRGAPGCAVELDVALEIGVTVPTVAVSKAAGRLASGSGVRFRNHLRGVTRARPGAR